MFYTGFADLAGLISFGSARVVACWWVCSVAAVWTPLPDPPPTEEELKMKAIQRPVTWNRLRTTFALAKADYVRSWQSIFPRLKSPASTSGMRNSLCVCKLYKHSSVFAGPEANETGKSDDTMTAKAAADTLRLVGPSSGASGIAPLCCTILKCFHLLICRTRCPGKCQGNRSGCP
jgi:hypothetical protein